jgi:outer membrane protein assembly factor BamD
MRKFFVWILIVLAMLVFEAPAYSAWIWSPNVGKWINPKKAAKDTPEQQFEWALGFYERRDWGRAIEEFEKLPANFPSSRLAAEGVYYSGLCWEGKADPTKAAEAYQRLVDRYPYSDRIKDAIRREFEIAGQFAAGTKMKVLGVPALYGGEKAKELYKHVVKNAPFGTYGDQAQFKIGEVYKGEGEYEEAQKAFQAVVDDYPASELVPQARYQIAYCSMQASKKSQYNEQYADRAIQEFQGFKENFPVDKQALEAEEAIKTLRAKKAQTYFEMASFYERQKKYPSAKVYYEEIVSKYPEAPVAAEARKKVDQLVKMINKEPEPKRGFRLW